MMWGYGMGWAYWLGMGVTMVLLWGLIIVGILALVRHFGGPRDTGRPQPPTGEPVHPNRPDRPDRPEEILAERFARGEIDDEEYRRRLEVLRAGR
ncbi:hypothetical protein GCM10017673_51330 [Streptosporangium violaceochromogenes]|nr:hypothetical protein GCM10017673_51330 [Streptosporangium violaceochromogenes]